MHFREDPKPCKKLKHGRLCLSAQARTRGRNEKHIEMDLREKERGRAGGEKKRQIMNWKSIERVIERGERKMKEEREGECSRRNKYKRTR